MENETSAFRTNQQSQSGEIPAKPGVVLRIGFIGHRRLRPDSLPQIESAIADCFATISQAVLDVHPNVAPAEDSPLVTRFYDRETRSLIRLVTGLAEGADLLAAQALEKTEADPRFHQHVNFERAGVIPFELQKYLDGRDESYRPTLLKLLKHPRFRYLTVLDGIYDKPTPDTKLAMTRRRRGYRAQSDFLLRQSDVLVAVADPRLGEEKPGGTLEAIRNALHFHIPVILIRAENCYETKEAIEGVPEISVRVFHPGESFQLVAEGRKDSNDQAKLEGLIRGEVITILADPDTENENYGTRRLHSGHRELIMYFHEPQIPSYTPSSIGENVNRGAKRIPTFRERIWTWTERHYRRPIKGKITEHRDTFQSRAESVIQKEDTLNTDDLQSRCQKNGPFKTYRDRSTELNYHFSGLYRGTYLLNFTL
ncbi:MAG: hypothetical protein KDA77_21605, partial [Planctomycetaceae bacterium]|nr:hypothetical protein [Planctomycetaceae bacterium]